MIAMAILSIFVIPLTIIQVQNQQNIFQQASETEIVWDTEQSAVASCPEDREGVVIKATFENTEPRRSSTDMDVVVKDQQTGKSVTMGTVRGEESKTVDIQTERQTINAGSVTFSLTWTDGRSGKDSRTASYKAVKDCIKPTPTPTLTPTPSPTLPPEVPTPTICPTLPPVKNVTIECPNCP